MKNYRDYAVVGVATLLVMFFLYSCHAREANVGSPQRPIFAPAAGSPIAVTCGASNVVVGDLNKDGKPDLIVACGQTRALTVLIATGGGLFRASNPISVPDGPGDMVLGDVNGDGNPAKASASCWATAAVTSPPAPGSPFLTGRGVWRLAVADMNGDGKLDVVTSNLESRNVSILLGQ